ncbi:MAG TPA: branched-chain amino acid ABC transporter permease [Solirubrobacterales bacterium]|nr:branched-chain amino acid ABC transporter permease [Solirubrobacterales bacterium]
MTEFLQQTFNGLSIGSVYVLVGVGLTLVFGVSRIMNYAQGQFLILGTFIAYGLVAAGAPWWLALAAAPVGVGIVGTALYAMMFRRLASDHLATFILTVGLGIVIQQLIVEGWGPEQRQIASPLTGGVEVGGVVFTDARLLLVGSCLPVVAGLVWTLGHTDLGRRMRATAENREVASLMGVDAARTTSAAFWIGSALAGLAGVLLGILFPFTAFSGNAFLIKGLAVALAGGIGNVSGAVVVGLALGLTETYGSAYLVGPEWQDGYAFVLLIAILAWRPRGLFRSTVEI